MAAKLVCPRRCTERLLWFSIYLSKVRERAKLLSLQVRAFLLLVAIVLGTHGEYYVGLTTKLAMRSMVLRNIVASRSPPRRGTPNLSPWIGRFERRHISSESDVIPSFPTSQNPLVLRNISSGAEVFLVGTAHISRKSIQLVRETINLVKPDQMYLELDEDRAKRLQDQTAKEDDSDPLQNSFVSSVFNAGQGSFTTKIIESLLKRMYQSFRNTGIITGGEFLEAIMQAEQLSRQKKCDLIYFDQHFQRTLNNLGSAVWKDFGSIFQSAVRGVGNKQMLNRVEELMKDPVFGGTSKGLGGFPSGRQSPGDPNHQNRSLFETLQERVENIDRAGIRLHIKLLRDIMPNLVHAILDQRDVVMTDHLIQAKGPRVVAVVGMAHMDGIERNWYEKGSAVANSHQLSS